MNAMKKFQHDYEEHMRHAPAPPTLAVKTKMSRSNEEPFPCLVTFFTAVEDNNFHIEIVRLDGQLFKVPLSCFIQMSLNEEELRDVLTDQEFSFDIDSPEEHTIIFSKQLVKAITQWLNNTIADVY
jgi:hypothetical protein